MNVKGNFAYGMTLPVGIHPTYYPVLKTAPVALLIAGIIIALITGVGFFVWIGAGAMAWLYWLAGKWEREMQTAVDIVRKAIQTDENIKQIWDGFTEDEKRQYVIDTSIRLHGRKF